MIRDTTQIIKLNKIKKKESSSKILTSNEIKKEDTFYRKFYCLIYLWNSRSELIEKLVFKNAKLLSQDNEIERCNDEIKRLDDVNEQHRKINGELSEEIKQEY